LESLILANAPGLRYLWNNLGLLLGEEVFAHTFVIVMAAWRMRFQNKVGTRK